MKIDQSVIDAYTEQECMDEIRAIKLRHQAAATDQERSNEQDNSLRVKQRLEALRNPPPAPRVISPEEQAAIDRQNALHAKLQREDLTLAEVNEWLRGGVS